MKSNLVYPKGTKFPEDKRTAALPYPEGYAVRITDNSYLLVDKEWISLGNDISLREFSSLWPAKEPVSYIPLTQCIKGHCYRLLSRNLIEGVFDGERGFVGIRTKFGSRYLFTEYHWDAPPYASARPLEDLGALPEDILPLEDLGTVDSSTGRKIWFLPAKGWFYEDTEELVQNKDAISRVLNSFLFDWLKGRNEYR